MKIFPLQYLSSTQFRTGQLSYRGSPLPLQGRQKTSILAQFGLCNSSVKTKTKNHWQNWEIPSGEWLLCWSFSWVPHCFPLWELWGAPGRLPPAHFHLSQPFALLLETADRAGTREGRALCVKSTTWEICLHTNSHIFLLLLVNLCRRDFYF